MGSNLIGQSAEERLTSQILELKQQVAALKTNQSPSLLSADGSIILDQATGEIKILNESGAAMLTISKTAGLYIGAAVLASAPFVADLTGHVTASSISVKDYGGNTVIDGAGLVSTTQFPSARIQGYYNFSTTSTTDTPVTGVAINFTTSREVKVFFYLQTDCYVAAESGHFTYPGFLSLYLDSNIITSQVISDRTWGTTLNTIVTVPAGSHTIQPRISVYNTTDGFTTIQFGQPAGPGSTSELGYIILGK